MRAEDRKLYDEMWNAVPNPHGGLFAFLGLALLALVGLAIVGLTAIMGVYR